MSAVISIVEDAGSSYSGYSSEVAKTIFYFLEIDSNTATKTNYPINLPTSGTKYSYEKWLRLRCDLAPLDRCENFLVWYDSGMPASGYTVTVNSDTVSSYTAPTNLQSTQGTRIDLTTKNSEAASIALDGTLEDIGDYTSYLVLQLEILSTALTSSDMGIDLIIQYDEF